MSSSTAAMRRAASMRDAAAKEELDLIARLDEAAAVAQDSGRYLDALSSMEKALILRHRIYGPKSKQVLMASKAAGELCNLLAMTYLQREEYSLVSELLKKAEILTEHDPAGRAVTYNNFACFSRQQGKLHAALTFLQRALKIEDGLTEVEKPADTHLNLCAVLSQLNKHKDALLYAQSALKLLHEELFGGRNTATTAPKADRVAVLAICYHNIGVECEFLKHYQASLQAYTKGVEVATVYLGADHGITATLRKSQRLARQEVQRLAASLGAPAQGAAGDDATQELASSRRRPAAAGSGEAARSPRSPRSYSPRLPAHSEESAAARLPSASPLRAAALSSLRSGAPK